MNQSYLASYSDADNLLIVRDWEKLTPVFSLGNMVKDMGLQNVARGNMIGGKVYNMGAHEIAGMVLDQ
jgi:hypothetical protein